MAEPRWELLKEKEQKVGRPMLNAFFLSEPPRAPEVLTETSTHSYLSPPRSNRCLFHRLEEPTQAKVSPLWSSNPPAPLIWPHLHLFVQLLLQLFHFLGEFALPCQGLSRNRRSHLPETQGERSESPSRSWGPKGPNPDPCSWWEGHSPPEAASAPRPNWPFSLQRFHFLSFWRIQGQKQRLGEENSWTRGKEGLIAGKKGNKARREVSGSTAGQAPTYPSLRMP